MTYLDTHVVIWLYAGEIQRFPQKVRNLLEKEDLYISPIVLLEIKYLNEIGKINAEPMLLYENLAATIGLKLCNQPFLRVITEAVRHDWTRDPFDRIIAGTANTNDSLLVSKDAKILKHCPNAVWE